MSARPPQNLARIGVGMVDPRDVRYRQQEAVPLLSHLAYWHRKIGDRGKSRKHANLYQRRAGLLICLACEGKLTDLEPGRSPRDREREEANRQTILERGRLSDLSADTIQAALATLRAAGRSSRCTHSLRAHFISNVVRNGASIKTTQVLARHAKYRRP